MTEALYGRGKFCVNYNKLISANVDFFANQGTSNNILVFFGRTPLHRPSAHYTARRFPLPTHGERLAFLFVPLTLSHRVSFSHPLSHSIHRETYTLHASRGAARSLDDSVWIHVRICVWKAAYSLRHLLDDSESKRRRSAMLRFVLFYHLS